MTLLKLLLVFLLYNEGIRGDILEHHLYQKPGDEVLLPILHVSLSETRCSDFDWLYNKDRSGTSADVRDGKVEKSSARAARLSLNSNCSLIIKNITAEDAGRYTGRYLPDSNWDTRVNLNILKISTSSKDTDPNEDEMTLTCSLLRYEGQCESSSLRWVDEQGVKLDGEGDGFKYEGQKNCASCLTVKHQTGLSRKYTCQYVDSTGVKIEAHYTTVSSGAILEHHLYQKPGDEVLLPNLQLSISETRCSGVYWLHNKDRSGISTDVKDGKVEKSSARAARLSLNSNCSLIIKNITDEDAGQYTCRYSKNSNWRTQVYLNILTISPSSTDTAPNEDGEVTLTCSLLRYEGQCESRSVRWVDEQGAELDGEGDGFKYEGQTNCVSYLTVKHQTGLSRRYTCQYVDSTDVKIEAHYPAVSSDPPRDDTIIFIIGGVVGLLVLLLVFAVILLKCRKQAKATKDVPKPVNTPEEMDMTYATVNEQHNAENKNDDTENYVTYATVSHSNQKVHQKKKVHVEEKVEEVTYSSVRTR